MEPKTPLSETRSGAAWRRDKIERERARPRGVAASPNAYASTPADRTLKTPSRCSNGWAGDF